MIYGPIAGLVIGIFSDVLGYFIGGASGMFFPGYTLDAMLAGFVYGLCFYKTKLTFAKCLYARLIVNLFVNVFVYAFVLAFVSVLAFVFVLAFELTL